MPLAPGKQVRKAVALVERGRVDDGLRVAGRALRSFRGRPSPVFNRMRPLKDALVRQVGPEAAARAYAEVAGLTVGEVTQLPIAGLQELAREQGLSYEEVSPGRTVQMPPPPMFEGDGPAGAEARARILFRCVLEDVVVSSKSNFLVAGERAVLDHQGDELEQVPWDFEMDPIAFGSGPDVITTLIESGGVSGPALEQGLPLAGLNTFNYWHWLIEFLPRVLIWREDPGFDAVPLIVDEQMPRQFLEALHFFAGRDAPVVVLKLGEAARVERLWTASMLINLPAWPKAGAVPPDAMTVLDGAAFAQQLEKLDPELDRLGGGGGPTRVYLRRRAEQFRGIVNTDEVEDWFAGQGFELVEMSDLGFLDQLRLIRGADVVVAPNGSALTNTVLARRGTRIGVLDNRYVEDNQWYVAMCDALEQPLSFLAGEIVADDERYGWNASYRIDVAKLPAFLDSLLSAR